MFKDRKDAAIQLGHSLEKFRDQDPLIIGIPRGGVETAYYVAKHLKAEMSLVVTRKIGHPQNPEYAIGAIAEDGSIYLSPIGSEEVSQEEIQNIIVEQKTEIKRRIQQFRKGAPFPDVKDRLVILVDDGIATGATLFATIMFCKNKHAKTIVVAAPVAGQGMYQKLLKMVDDVTILETPIEYRAVSQVYENFYNLSDEETISFLEKWEKEKSI